MSQDKVKGIVKKMEKAVKTLENEQAWYDICQGQYGKIQKEFTELISTYLVRCEVSAVVWKRVPLCLILTHTAKVLREENKIIAFNEARDQNQEVDQKSEDMEAVNKEIRDFNEQIRDLATKEKTRRLGAFSLSYKNSCNHS